MGNPRRRMAGSRRRGSALVYALATVLLIGGLSASFLQLSTGTSRRQCEGLEKKEAFYLAEAGLTEALVGLGQGRTGNVGTSEKPVAFGDGLFWVTATDLGGGLTELECTAKAGGATALLSIVVEEGKPSVAALGLFGLEALDILPGSLIDAYESSAGPYTPPPAPPTAAPSLGGKNMTAVQPTTYVPQVQAVVGSGLGVTITGTSALPTRVYGDVFAGPESAVTVSGSVTVSGQQDTLLAEAELPAILLPSLPSQAGVDHSSEYPLIVPPGTNGYDYLHVQSNAEVIIEGPATLVLGSLDLEPEASLTLDASNGPIDIFVTDQVQLAPTSNLDVTPADPTLVSIQVTSDPEEPLELFANGPFYGLFYAPQADVEVASSFEVFGSMVAQHLGFVGPVKLHFDETLASKAGKESWPSLMSWRIVDLENQIGAAGADPFVLLGVDPSLSLPPALSHEDQFVEILYLDTNNVQQTYQGWEQSFDWSNVSTVIEMSRDGSRVCTAASGLLSGIKRVVAGLIPIGP